MPYHLSHSFVCLNRRQEVDTSYPPTTTIAENSLLDQSIEACSQQPLSALCGRSRRVRTLSIISCGQSLRCGPTVQLGSLPQPHSVCATVPKVSFHFLRLLLWFGLQSVLNSHLVYLHISARQCSCYVPKANVLVNRVPQHRD